MRPRLVGFGIALGLVLTLATLLYVQHVSVVGDYEATFYGLPLPMFFHFTDELTPAQAWYPEFGGIIIDYLLWLAVSFAVISITYARPRSIGRISSSIRSYLPRDVIAAILILAFVSLFVFPVFPFPQGYDSTSDPRVAGLPLAAYCYCSVQISPNSWTSTFQVYWASLVADLVFWVGVLFVLDSTLHRKIVRGEPPPQHGILAHICIRESHPPHSPYSHKSSVAVDPMTVWKGHCFGISSFSAKVSSFSPS